MHSLKAQSLEQEMKILIVDDDDFALDLLEAALQGAGYSELTMAASGAEALAIVEVAKTPFDVFLLDIQMPGMNGIELCARIRSLPDYGSAPIIMITAMQERHFIDHAFAAGAMDYINKPFDPVELGVRIGIASRLSLQAHRIEEYATETALIKARTGVGAAFEADQPVTIFDVPRVISMTAMENYLLRLSFWMCMKSKSVVFSIPGFGTIHAQTSPSDLYDILCDTADAITKGLKHTNHLVTYVGDGHFIAVVNGRNVALNAETLWTIQSELEQALPVLSTGVQCPVTLNMGEVYIPSVWTASNRLNLLLCPQLTSGGPEYFRAQHRAAA